MFGVSTETLYNIAIPFAVYIQSQAFMYPESMYEPINHKLRTYYPDFYDHFEIMLQLRAINTDEPGWNLDMNPIEMLDEDDWDNELPTLIYHSHGAHC